MYSFAKLDSQQLQNLQKLEEKEGVRLIAVEEWDVKPAAIPEKTLQVIQQLEKELGICLIAVK